MLVTRRSPLSRRETTLDLDVSIDQMEEFQLSIRRRTIQDIFPNLTAEQREFILTGYTPEDWAKMFPPEEE